jgi:hypothetical protein
MRKYVLLVGLFFVAFMDAQELNCIVKVNAEKIAGTNKQIFSTLEKSLNDFVNKTEWTGQEYKSNERISGLLYKISNQIIQRCKAKINVDDMLDGDVEKCIEDLNDAIDCGKRWR